MPKIIAVSKTDFENSVPQDTVKQAAGIIFQNAYSNIDKMLSVFDNSEIDRRNLCRPIIQYGGKPSFSEKNRIYQNIALDYSVIAVEDCLKKASIDKSVITDIIYVNTTGLAAPSIDSLITNKMRLNKNINRMPLWGLGCAGGVSALAKANTIAKANPDAVIVIAAVELCSLTFIDDEFSKSNFIAASLFSDGAACVLVAGDKAFDRYCQNAKTKIDIIFSESKLYYDAAGVMGWEIIDSGFKVIFGKEIPDIIRRDLKKDIDLFLGKNNLDINDITNFIFHPGGAKVLNAYEESLGFKNGELKISRDILRNYGNMSSVTVLYMLDKFISNGFKNGYGLMLALGPGFSNEMLLLKIEN
ncbi:MAG: 3-oxoacyl-[acyl-carrier-protein] synthase III C-terminal domain-containing protein [Ignavibacteria bacterium]|nr:3-oxoacyl-[acyl-carrier-protein] synthase III C-terminal domain-containing protein [Ignavibacteria bacterium]